MLRQRLDDYGQVRVALHHKARMKQLMVQRYSRGQGEGLVRGARLLEELLASSQREGPRYIKKVRHLNPALHLEALFSSFDDLRTTESLRGRDPDFP